MRGLSDVPRRVTVRRPSVTFSFAIVTFGLAEGLEAAGSELGLLVAAPVFGFCAGAGASVAGFDLLFPPRLEKFHLSLFSALTRLISGWFSVRLVTLRVLEKTSGISSTPTLSDLACTNGVLLN